MCYIALTALKVHDACLWYLDSGCSRHMIGNKALFKTLFEGKIGSVTFWRWEKIYHSWYWYCRYLKATNL